MTTVTGSSPLSYRSILTVTVISALYLVVSALLIGFKTDQLFLVILFNTLYYSSRATRRFILGFSVFIIFWILFDSMKAFPNYRFNTVHIEDIYNTEKRFFGISSGDGRTLTPNEYWLLHANTFLDILTGLCYLCWIPLPLGFGVYLFYKDRRSFFNFSLTFLLTNMIGFIIYYVFPAAPPWYVEQYGFPFHAATPGNTAGFARFDHFFHLPIFSSLYAKSSNVFAAMPSLHSSYPLIVFYYGVRTKLRRASIVFAGIMIGIWFAAVYSSHHYVLDVIAGICCGLSGITLFNYLSRKSALFGRFLDACERVTA
jgi:hypothetical protein